MRKLFTEFPIDGAFSLSSADAHHLLVVLRKRCGDCVAVTDSVGTTYECRIADDTGGIPILQPLRVLSERKEGSGQVFLAAGLLKNDKFEWVVQKAVELGVAAVIPVQMEHCVVKLNDNRRRDRQARWQRIAQEAAKQCGRDDVPTVAPVVSFAELLQRYGAYPFLIPYEKETTVALKMCRTAVQNGDLVICIGPEGGFAPAEIEMAQQLAHCTTVSLGPRILRAETASLAALAIIMYERGFK